MSPVAAHGPLVGAMSCFGPATLVGTSSRQVSTHRSARAHRSVPRRWGALSRGNARTSGAGRGRAGTRPLGTTPRSAKLSLGSWRVTSGWIGGAPPPARLVLHCPVRPARARPPVASSRSAPRACGSRRGPRSRARWRASVSGECGHRALGGFPEPGRAGARLGRGWGAPPPGGSRGSPGLPGGPADAKPTRSTWDETLWGAHVALPPLFSLAREATGMPDRRCPRACCVVGPGAGSAAQAPSAFAQVLFRARL